MRALAAQLLNKAKAIQTWARTHPVVGEVYEIVDGSIGDYVRDHGLMYAAAVAFYALLSLIPLMVLFASVAGFTLNYIGGGSESEVKTLLSEIFEQLRVAIPYIDKSFQTDLLHIVESRRSLGFVGLLAVLISASQVFRALEFSFARIFARSSHDVVEVDPQPRNVVVSKLVFGGFVTAIVGVVMVFKFMLGVIYQWAEALPPRLAAIIQAPLEASGITRSLTALMLILGFVVVLRFFGGRRVKTRFAFMGGVVFCVAFLVLEWGYDLYLARWSDFGVLYGPFAALMTVVLWIFIISTLILICGHFVKTIQRRVVHGPRWEKRWAGKTVTEARSQDDLSSRTAASTDSASGSPSTHSQR